MNTSITGHTRLCYLRRQMQLYVPDLNARVISELPHHPELRRLLLLNEQLNDDIIHHYSELLTLKSKRPIHILSSLEWCNYEVASDPCKHSNPLRAAQAYLVEQKLKRERKPLGRERIKKIQAAEYLLFPINVAQVHWILGVIDVKHQQIHIYDSLQSTEHKQTARRLQIYAQIYMSDNEFSWTTDVTVNYVQLNHQGQTLDCGVHVLGYMRSIAHSKHQQIDFDETDIPSFRRLFTYELMMQTLDDVGI